MGQSVFYISYLPDVAFPNNKIAQVTWIFHGLYWQCIALALQPVYGNDADAYGIEGTAGEAMQAMRYSFVSVGIWWLGFSQGLFISCPKGIRTTKK